VKRVSRATHALVAVVALALVSLLAACAHSSRTGASPSALGAWEARYAAAPECGVRVTPGGAPSSGATRAGDATLVVRLVAFGSRDLLDFAHLSAEPLDGASRTGVRADSSGPVPAAFAFALPAGRYALLAQSFGYQARTDTVVARPGVADTVVVALEEYEEALRNAHNCRPRGFRHPGERACVTDQISTVLVIDRARDFSSHRFRFGLGFPPGDSVHVSLVDDERICERAANIYGLEKGPPRRVVVVEAGNIYVVYDPAEPVLLGDLNQWLILDKRWRVLARMAL
jgi:hypothetical protein